MLNVLGIIFLIIAVVATIVLCITGVLGAIFSNICTSVTSHIDNCNVASKQHGEKLEIMRATCQKCNKQLVYLATDDVHLHSVTMDGKTEYICDECFNTIKELWNAEKNGSVKMSDSLRKLADALMQPESDKKKK